ncbi:tripartite tricarboxylate transporter substrate binding protein [Metabacillus arenae]|uniref:Tripartite tricarboxylate transporter substrate binding protein n=1 Tax=Metabacillus arenae TaxID=2771434 RepID=A0A926NKL1_9BACI|nr:tripartite tricarboxylate transporter substrate binding protein [Metabacillus arenae]MBD1379551.1 tripartite tricarboxylate transporter substrate binding protein [Metabacillus arenae]
MKKLISIIFMAVLVFGVMDGCSSTQEANSNSSSDKKANFPTKPISIIVAYDAGGGTDTTARTLQPFLEDELGVPVNIMNKPGGSGWVGWTEIANSKPDGYTIGFLNSPNLASGLVNPTMEKQIDLDKFEYIGNHVTDPGVVAIRVDDERFSNFKELVEYAKKNEVTTTATGVAGDDHLVTLKLNEALGTKFRDIQFDGTAKSRAAFLGGHVDVLISSVGEAYPMHQEKQLKAVAVTAEEKSPFLPDVPTVAEAGFDPVISQSTRGLVAPVGVDQEKIDILQKALKNAAQTAEHEEKMKELGTQAHYVNGEEYRKLLEQDKKDIEGLKELLGW